MTNSNKKKQVQLGIPHGTATHQLRKLIIFRFIKVLGLDNCFQCGHKIANVDELSIEHKIPWLDSENPKELFFDLDNIAFSHLKCNSGAARQTRIAKHPSEKSYDKGCRCDKCREIQKMKKRKQRALKK